MKNTLTEGAPSFFGPSWKNVSICKWKFGRTGSAAIVANALVVAVNVSSLLRAYNGRGTRTLGVIKVFMYREYRNDQDRSLRRQLAGAI
jgi:hypothetical protein